MNTKKIEIAVSLSERIGCVFIATADATGKPHVTAAGKMELSSQGSITVREWFCPGTLDNLQVNKYVSVIVWDKDRDMGYQILGALEKVKELGVLDGYAPEVESVPPLPQVERQLFINVQSILDFKAGPHSDQES